MKKYLLPIVVLVFLSGTSCQEKIDIEKEKEAIMAVIQEEADAFIAMDIERLSAIYVHDSLNTRLAGSTIYAGWDEVKTLYESMFEGFSEWEDPKNWKENAILKVTDDYAWAIFDNVWSWSVKGETSKMVNIQITFLEKIEDDWKISFNAFVSKPEPEEEVEVGEEEPEVEETE